MSGYIGKTTLLYTPIEYIESTGTQYIDLAYNPNQNTGFEMDFIPYNDISSSPWADYFGANDSGSNNRFSMNTYPATGGGEFYIAGTAYNPYLVKNTRKQITYKNSVFSDNDGHTYTVSKTFTITRPLFIFNRNLDGSPSGRGGSMRLYSLKLYNGNTLVKNFIPAKDGNDVAGLYETIESKFYYNKGTGTFAAGSETGQAVYSDVARTIKNAYVGVSGVARKIKNGYVGVTKCYTPVEYIGSTGVQYIDTGYIPSSNTKVELKVSDFPAAGNKWQALYGARTDANTSDKFSMHCNNNNIYVFDYGSYRTQFPSGMSIINETVITQNKNVATIGSETVTCSSATFTSSCNMYIFCLNSKTYRPDGAAFKLYYFKIWNNDVLVRDFIPVLDVNNIACLYDLVEGKFYYNQGTGTFTAGSETGEKVVLGSFARLCFKKSIYQSFIELCQNNTGKSAASKVLQYQTLIENTMANNGKDVNEYHTIHAYMSSGDMNITFVVPTTYWYAFNYQVSGQTMDFYIQGQTGSQRIRIDSGGNVTYYGSTNSVDYNASGVIGVFSKEKTSGTPDPYRCVVEVIPSDS